MTKRKIRPPDLITPEIVKPIWDVMYHCTPAWCMAWLDDDTTHYMNKGKRRAPGRAHDNAPEFVQEILLDPEIVSIVSRIQEEHGATLSEIVHRMAQDIREARWSDEYNQQLQSWAESRYQRRGRDLADRMQPSR